MEDQDFEKLSLKDKLGHKSWKARQLGYEELLKSFKQSDASDLVFKENSFALQIAVNDPNQIAQEFGLSVVVEYVMVAVDAKATKMALIPPLIEKCLASTRSGTRAKALEVLLLVVESEGSDFESLLASLDHKTPKNVAAAIAALREILTQFGSKTFMIKPVVKVLPKLFDHRDKNVRQEVLDFLRKASNLTVELYRWIGSAFSSSLNELKPVQLKELNTLFEELPNERPTPTRYVRGSEPKETTSDPANQPNKIEIEENVIDAYNLSDPVSFIEKIPKSFYVDILSTKWKERKECLEQLLPLVSFPKLEDGKYFELINILAKRLQDPNIMVLTLTAEILSKMASGLKSSFAQYKNIVLPALLERTKEKKQNVLEALRNGLDTLFMSINRISDILDDVSSFISHANPSIRKETIDFLVRSLKKPGAYTDICKSELKNISEKLVKAMDDSNPETRDAACTALGTFIKKFSERTMLGYLDRLEKSKMQKVLESSKTEEHVKIAGPNSLQLPRSNSTLSKSTESVNTITSNKEIPIKVIPKAKMSSGKFAVKSLSSRQNSDISLNEPIASTIKYQFTDESAIDYIYSMIPQDQLKDINDSSWKVRLTGVQSFAEKLIEQKEIQVEALIRFIIQKIGWKESNFQVLIAAISIIQSFANVDRGFNPACATLCAPGLIEKLGDLKVKKNASSCLDSIIECSSVELVFSEAYTVIAALKSPKIISDSLLWMNQTLKDFGITGLNIKKMIHFLKTLFLSSAAPVRLNTTLILVTLNSFGKFNVKDMILDAPANILSLYETENEKRSCVSAPTAIKTQILVYSKNESFDDDSLIQKIDLSSKFGVDLINQMTDSNWKERKSALDELSNIVNNCPAIHANLSSEIISALKSRISDSNKNLSLLSVDICGNIAKKMGKPFDKYVKILIGPMLSLLADQKPLIRNNVLLNLDKIVSVIDISVIYSNVAASLQQDQPQIRKDLLKWILQKKDDISADSSEISSLIPPIFMCLQDRNVDVRKSAQMVLCLLSEVVEITSLKAKASDIYQGAQLASLMPFLDALMPKSMNSIKITKNPSPRSTATPTDLIPQNPKSSKMIKSSTSVCATRKEVNISAESTAADSRTLLTFDGKGKDLRASQDKGILKWIFDSPRRELIDLLSEQCESTFNTVLHELLFSNAHYKEKDYLAGLKLLDSFFTEPNEMEYSYYLQVVVSNADLVLKYLTIRFCDTNTSILIKCLEVLDHFLNLLDQGSYFLNEYEAACFLPFFINKLGDPKETMRVKLRSITKQLGRVYPVSKLFIYLLKGLESKNSRTRVECLDELVAIVQRNGQNVFVASKCVATIAAQVGDRDPSVRNSALNLICQIYNVLGDDIFQYFSKLSEKEKDLINERFKRQPGKVSVGLARVISKKLPVPNRTNSPIRKDDVDVELRSPIPTRKQFSLDYDKLDLVPQPKVFETNDKSNHRPNPPLLVQKSSTVSLELQDGISLEARLEIITEKLSADDWEVTLEAARLLEKLLMAHPNNEILRTIDVVMLINSLASKFFTNLLTLDPLCLKLCKHFVSILVQAFSSKESSLFVPYESVEDCVRKVLFRLVDPNVQMADGTKSLHKSLNMLMVRIIDNCNPNVTFKSLLQILRESCLEEQIVDSNAHPLQMKFIELVMKCLWKITKVLPIYLKNNQIIVQDLLKDVELFFEDLPPSYWKRRVSESKNSQIDMPLRTVKTILHELVNGLEENLMNFTEHLSNQENSHTMNYLNQMLLSVSRKKGILQEKNTSNNSMMIDPKVEEEIDSIFTQIADKTATKSGLRRLYLFQKKFPLLKEKINERINSTGSYFQGYIRRGLDSLAVSENEFQYQNGKEIAGSDYAQTLKDLQQMFNNSEAIIQPNMVETVKKTPNYESEHESGVTQSRESRSLAVKELKARLARMKMTMNS